jgi:cell division protein FtsL
MTPFCSLAKINRENEQKNKWKDVIFKPLYVNLVIILMICVVGCLYLAEVNKATTKGYRMRDLEKRIQGVEETNRKLEFQATELQSLNSVGERVKTLGMVPTEKVKYVKAPGPTVAVR